MRDRGAWVTHSPLRPPNAGGGIPWWLHKLNATLQIRTYAEPYISAVDAWWNQLLPYLKSNKMLYSDGGPVIMAQVENEYGSYGNVAESASDRQYIVHLVNLARTLLGNDIVLYTTDGGSLGYMTRGSLNDSSVYTVGDFGPGSNPLTSFAAQDAFNPPPMRGAHLCSEFYSGWLTHWGEHMANTSSAGLADAMNGLFALNGSLSLYMGHGGTNFGTWAGANGGGTSFEPHITSYDYDSPLSENGAHGYGSDGVDKYAAVQEVLLNWTARDGGNQPPAEAPANAMAAYGAVPMTESAALLSPASLAALCAANATLPAGDAPLAFHQLNVSDGLVWMRSPRPGPADARGAVVDLSDPHDRAQVWVDGAYAGVVWRPEAAPVTVAASSPAGSGAEVGVLVESMGRLNYGGSMYDLKGIGPNAVPSGAAPTIAFGSAPAQTLPGPWSHCAIPLTDSTPSLVPFAPVSQDAATPSAAVGVAPTFFRGTFTTPAAVAPADTYIGMYGWTKGYVWINGNMLGRFWESKGPQHTLYTPAAFLNAAGSANEVVVLEMDVASPNMTVVSVSAPDFHFGSTCDLSGVPQAGDRVVMYSSSAKGPQQSWNVPAKGASGPITLTSDPRLCIQAGPSTDPSTGRPAIQLGGCAAGNPAQTWTTKTDGSLTVASDATCMDITAHGTTDGSGVETYSCNGGTNQLWTMPSAPSGSGVLIQSQMDPQVLTVCAANP